MVKLMMAMNFQTLLFLILTQKLSLTLITIKKGKTMTPKEIKALLNAQQYVEVGNDSFFRIAQANEKTIASKALLEQLKAEGKYNYWFTAYDFKSKTPDEPILSEVLPVFGDPNKYVTKWFYYDKEQAMREAVRRLKKLL